MSLSSTPVNKLHGVGAKKSEQLQRLKIVTVQDVLFHLPLRYQDRTRLLAVADLQAGMEAVFCGVVVSTEVVFRGRRSLLCRIADHSGEILLRFFHFSNQQREGLREGQRLRCFGEIRRGPHSLEIVHPEYQMLKATEMPVMADRLTAIYPVTEGLHQLSLRKIAQQALTLLQQDSLVELLPTDWLPKNVSQCSLQQALLTVHQPGPEVSAQALQEGSHPAVQRLSLEELVAHRLSVYRGRQAVRSHLAPVVSQRTDGQSLLCRLLASLPFEPTNAQRRVIAEIATDLNRPQPMLRLVQGDVGAGKTLVAAAAAAMVLDAGYQVSIMAPTEILAEQHFLSFSHWFEPLGIKLTWLVGKLAAAARREAMQAITAGDSGIVIGTHALFQKQVSFARLGLTIVDEQHRFGVEQRLLLREKGVSGDLVPHQLTMTATPIPRTLAMTAYADLDCSIIDELPPGRQPIKTVALSNSRRSEVIERVGAAIQRGQQVYWVCTLIEESELLQARAAEDAMQELRVQLPQATVNMVHGRMSASEKELAMLEFKDRKTQLLVATTVIEVGVDVPNASLIIIENVERLGLSQLHQLRGRVGRGEVASSCVLMFEPGLSQRAKQRIAIMRETTDGFVIAEKDLQIRGAGELLGTRQTGEMRFRIADVMRDTSLLDQAQQLSDKIMAQCDKAHCDALIERWMGSDAPDYSNV